MGNLGFNTDRSLCCLWPGPLEGRHCRSQPRCSVGRRIFWRGMRLQSGLSKQSRGHLAGHSSNKAQSGAAEPSKMHKTTLEFLQGGFKTLQNLLNLLHSKVALTEPMTCSGTDKVFLLANNLFSVSCVASQEAAAFRPF